jgi:hypothetical protein
MYKIKRLFQIIYLFFFENLIALYNANNHALLKKNIDLKNKFNGQRVFIVMTGQSVSNFDLPSLKDEYVMGVNFMMLHHNFREAGVNFYCLPGSWNTSTEDKLNWILTNVYANSDDDAYIFIQASSYMWAKNNHLYKKNNTYFTHSDVFIPGENPPYCGLGRIEKGSFSFSIGAAIDMGFKEIFLVGADYAKTPQVVGHFYSPEDDIQEHSPELLNFHQKIQEYANSKGVKIYNIVNEGFTSPIFEEIKEKDIRLANKKLTGKQVQT